MASGDTHPEHSPLMAEVEKVARAQERTVSQVLAETVDLCLKDERWFRLKAYGAKRPAAAD